jgi:hypothetical protein
VFENVALICKLWAVCVEYTNQMHSAQAIPQR